MEENILDDDIKQQITGTVQMELKSSSIWILVVATTSIILGVLLLFVCSAVLFGTRSNEAVFLGFLLGTGFGGISLFYLAWVQFWYSKAVHQLPVSTQNNDTVEDASLESIYLQMIKVWKWGAVVTIILVLMILSLLFLTFYSESSSEMPASEVRATVESVQTDTNWVAPTTNFFEPIEEE